MRGTRAKALRSSERRCPGRKKGGGQKTKREETVHIVPWTTREAKWQRRTTKLKLAPDHDGKLRVVPPTVVTPLTTFLKWASEIPALNLELRLNNQTNDWLKAVLTEAGEPFGERDQKKRLIARLMFFASAERNG